MLLHLPDGLRENLGISVSVPADPSGSRRGLVLKHTRPRHGGYPVGLNRRWGCLAGWRPAAGSSRFSTVRRSRRGLTGAVSGRGAASRTVQVSDQGEDALAMRRGPTWRSPPAPVLPEFQHGCGHAMHRRGPARFPRTDRRAASLPRVVPSRIAPGTASQALPFCRRVWLSGAAA